MRFLAWRSLCLGAGLLVVLGLCQCGGGVPEPAQAAAPTQTARNAATPPSSPPEGGEKSSAKTAERLTKSKGRVIILGFDGVEPSIVDGLIAAGQMPNFAKLRDQGAYRRLRSANPPQSPTAWSSFTTCKSPGNHGVYDFLLREPRNYMPGVGFGAMKQPTLAPDGAVAQPAKFVNYRKGEPFWVAANAHGARCKVLTVPFAYPADDLTDSCMLCGLGVPDLRGTTSTFFLMSDSFTPDQAAKQDLAGGLRIPLRFEGDTATIQVPGARDPRQPRATYVEVPVTIRADRQAHKLSIGLPGQTIEVAENEWTKWIEWQFEVTPKFTVKAISRIHVLEAGQQVRMYMTCLQFHPEHPLIPISAPPEYSGELADRYGLYRTVGWDLDTHALRQDALTEDLFLEDAQKLTAWRETLTLDELERGNCDLLISAWTATDRVAHLFWRFRDPKHPLYTEEGAKKYGHAVEDTYIQMDQIVGNVMQKLHQGRPGQPGGPGQPGDLLMVLSDHGFHSFRKGFNVNTWLIRNGYLAVSGQDDPATACNDQDFLVGYDWTRTKAYSLGLGTVYLNIKGREGQGTVDANDASAVRQELKDKLMTIVDPETGDKVFRAVYTRDEAYRGVAEQDAPDLELGYAEGYQSTKSAAKGVAPRHLFEPNTDKWSGEHAASDVEFTPGIFLCNQPIKTETPAIIDLGVTALEYLGVAAPADAEGKPLL